MKRKKAGEGDKCSAFDEESNEGEMTSFGLLRDG